MATPLARPTEPRRQRPARHGRKPRRGCGFSAIVPLDRRRLDAAPPETDAAASTAAPPQRSAQDVLERREAVGSTVVTREIGEDPRDVERGDHADRAAG